MTAEDKRVIQSKEKVIASTRSLLCSSGVDELSIEGIASESGVAKTTIYRHWESLDDVLADTFEEMFDEFNAGDSGSVLKDVTTYLEGLVDCLNNQDWSRAMPHLMERSKTDARFKKMKNSFMKRRLKPLTEALNRGVERGELKKDTDIPFVINQLTGPIYTSYMYSPKPVTQKQAREIAQNVMGIYIVI